MRTKTVISMVFLSILIWRPAVTAGQTVQPPSHRVPIIGPPDDDTYEKDQINREAAKKANEDRAASLKADTDKLLKLATELKASVDKSNENILSVDVIKKADEIEKLAHSVKDKMRGPN